MIEYGNLRSGDVRILESLLANASASAVVMVAPSRRRMAGSAATASPRAATAATIEFILCLRRRVDFVPATAP